MVENIPRLSITLDKEVAEQLYEKGYTQGQRSAYKTLLLDCLRGLGREPKTERDCAEKLAVLVVEREETISLLRRLCQDFGDNNWEGDLRLVDIIKKHLIW
jgi:hypothetical protein